MFHERTLSRVVEITILKPNHVQLQPLANNPDYNTLFFTRIDVHMTCRVCLHCVIDGIY